MATRLVKPILLLTLAEVLFNLSGYVIHSVAGRVLGPADYGRYGLVVTLTTTVIILIGNGIPTAMSRYLSEYFEKDPEMVCAIKRTGARLQLFLIADVTAIFFFAAPFFSHLLGDPSLTPLFRFSSLIIPAFAASSFYFYYFTGIHLFHYQAILKMARAILRIVITVSLVFFYKIYGAIAGYILVPFLTFLLGFFFDRTTSADFAGENTVERTFSWRLLLSSAWPITLFLVFYEIFISIDLYLVKAFLASDTETGYYNAATTLARLPSYLFYALSIVLLPALAKLKSDGDPQKISNLLGSALRYAGIILLPMFILLSSYAEPIMTLFFGKAYFEAVPIFRILVFGLSFLTVFYTVAMGMIGLGHARLVALLAALGTFANAGLIAFLIPSTGTLGAAWATTITTTLITITLLILMRRFVEIPISFFGIAKTLFAGVILFIGTAFFPSNSIFFVFPATLLSAGYLALLFLLEVLAGKDAENVLSIFGRKKNLPKTR